MFWAWKYKDIFRNMHECILYPWWCKTSRNWQLAIAWQFTPWNMKYLLHQTILNFSSSWEWRNHTDMHAHTRLYIINYVHEPMWTISLGACLLSLRFQNDAATSLSGGRELRVYHNIILIVWCKITKLVSSTTRLMLPMIQSWISLSCKPAGTSGWFRVSVRMVNQLSVSRRVLVLYILFCKCM